MEERAYSETLKRFAVAEYWYIRGGVNQFSLSILNAPDLESQRFFHERLTGELEYLSRFQPFLAALDLVESEVELRSPHSGALNAVITCSAFAWKGDLLTRRWPGIWSGGSSRIRARQCERG